MSSTCARLGLGTWQLGGASEFAGRTNGWGAMEDSDASAILHAALDADIRVFDTSDAYGKGLSEIRVGHVIGNRADCVVISKCGQREQDAQAQIDFSAAWLVEAVEQSLRRLRRDCIDLLLLHSPPVQFDYASVDATVFERLMRAGKIAGAGVSVRSIACAQRVENLPWVNAVELVFNAVDRRAAALFAASKPATRKLTWIARSVLASGSLARGALRQFAADDHRAHLPHALSNWFADQDRQLDWLGDLPGGKAVSLLRFALSFPELDIALLGVRHATQLAAIVQARQLGALSEEMVLRIATSCPDLFPGWL